MKKFKHSALVALWVVAIACVTTTTRAEGAREEILRELRDTCASRLDEVLERDFRTTLNSEAERVKFCPCADEQFQLDPVLDRIADMPPAERQRPSDAWIHLDTAYFLAGLDCIRPRPGWENAGRSIGEIRAAIDRNKALFYGAYMQALKSQPDLNGRVQVDFTIAPSGKVIEVRMEPRDFGGSEFAKNLEALFWALDFGAKKVSKQTVRFPLDFLPQ